MDIIHDTANRLFVLPLKSGLNAKVNYTLDSCSGMMQLVHSEVPNKLRGQGIGKELVLKTFEKLSKEGYQATAVCSYIKLVAKRDPKWSSIIG